MSRFRSHRSRHRDPGWLSATAFGVNLPADSAIPVRTELVARVRRAIADGTYDTPERWAAALDKLARSLTERK